MQGGEPCATFMPCALFIAFIGILHCLQTRTFTYGDYSVVLKEGALGDGTGAKVHCRA